MESRQPKLQITKSLLNNDAETELGGNWSNSPLSNDTATNFLLIMMEGHGSLLRCSCQKIHNLSIMRKHPKSPKSNRDTVYKITDPYQM